MGCPPWWPEGEPWPPVRSGDQWRRGRQRFLLRVGVFFVFALFFGAFGVARIVRTLAEGAGLVVPAPLIALAVVWLVLGVVFLSFGGMQRVGVPMGDIASAAERVGSGDFSVRLAERGPMFLRSVARAFNTMTARLEARQRQRRDLMADVAHELRTPLSVMRGRLEGLVDGVYARDDETLTQLIEETKYLERLVEDLRTLSHAEGGTLKLQREATDLSVLIGDVVRAFAGDAQAGGISLNAPRGEELPLVEIDPVRIREVLANLVSNALRHTPRGGQISVTASAGAGKITVRVEDTGSGISQEDLPNVFDRFAKGVDSAGSGLGLAIAKKLVEAHGGEIHAASEAGKGTTITLSVPVSTSI